MVRLALVAIVPLVAMACAQAPAGTSTTVTSDDPELIAIVTEDQADREGALDETDWASVGTRDAARRARVREMIESGRLRTGRDFERAALVFQHGTTSADILLAHVLAMTALAEGHTDSRRMAALTLDRYLTRIGQPQVFGTNFTTPDASQPAQWSLEPYDESLVPDALRALNCVASREATRTLLWRLQTTGDLSDPEPVCDRTSQ